MLVSALGSRPSAGRTSRVKVFAQTFPYKAFSCYVVLRCSDATLGPSTRSIQAGTPTLAI